MNDEFFVPEILKVKLSTMLDGSYPIEITTLDISKQALLDKPEILNLIRFLLTSYLQIEEATNDPN